MSDYLPKEQSKQASQERSKCNSPRNQPNANLNNHKSLLDKENDHEIKTKKDKKCFTLRGEKPFQYLLEKITKRT